MITKQTYINADDSNNLIAASIVTFVDGLPSSSENVILTECTAEQINTIKNFNTFLETLPSN